MVVKAEDSQLNGCGFKSWHRIIDGCKRIASYYIKEKLKIKVAKWGTPKKYLTTTFGLLNQTSTFRRGANGQGRVVKAEDSQVNGWSGGELLEMRLLDSHLLDTFGSKSIARHKFYQLLESS